MTQNFQTENFHDSFAIFQGGGIKVISLIGAYEACISSGIRFSGVAGTSGGAIVASLIAAGYTPIELKSLLFNQDFSKFLKNPKKINNLNQEVLLRIIRKASDIRKKNLLSGLIRMISLKGIFSAESIEEWLNEKICQKLNLKKQIAEFRDLDIPLIVVAADLVSGKPKVWSTYDTPDFSIAKAVRASSSIPLFFQPLVESDAVYVDGGMLSNLPISLAYSLLIEKRKLNHPLLAFTLTSTIDTYGANFPWSTIKYFEKLSDTIVSGNIEIQKSTLHRNVTVIPIETKGFSATDFNKMTPENKEVLFDFGVSAVKEFVAHEEDYLTFKEVNEFEKCIHYIDDYYSRLQEIFEKSHKEIIIVCKDLDWVFKLILTVSHAVFKGVKIYIFYKRNEGEKNKHRLNLLKNIGCYVEVLVPEESLDLSGVFADPNSEANCRMIINNNRAELHGVIASYYHSSYDYHVIHSITNSVKNIYIRDKKIDFDFAPSYHRVDIDYVRKRMKGNIPFYQHKRIKIHLEDVEIDDAVPHIGYIHNYKIKQIKLLNKIYEQNDFSLYEPLGIKLMNGKFSLILPPVLEQKKGRRHLLEGHTRFFVGISDRTKKVKAIVVTEVDESLPSSPKKWKDVKVIYGDEDPIDIFRGNKQDMLRNIESLVRDVNDWNDLSEMIGEID